jgi:hypothetical protein
MVEGMEVDDTGGSVDAVNNGGCDNGDDKCDGG